VACDDPVADFVVLRFRDQVPRYQFARALERTFRNNAVGFVLSDPRQVQQVFPRCRVDVDGLIAAHAFFYAFHHGLGVAPHGLGGRGSAAADFLGIVLVVGAGGDAR
jgi:hypothetical protein